MGRKKEGGKGRRRERCRDGQIKRQKEVKNDQIRTALLLVSPFGPDTPPSSRPLPPSFSPSLPPSVLLSLSPSLRLSLPSSLCIYSPPFSLPSLSPFLVSKQLINDNNLKHFGHRLKGDSRSSGMKTNHFSLPAGWTTTTSTFNLHLHEKRFHHQVFFKLQAPTSLHPFFFRRQSNFLQLERPAVGLTENHPEPRRTIENPFWLFTEMTLKISGKMEETRRTAIKRLTGHLWAAGRSFHGGGCRSLV